MSRIIFELDSSLNGSSCRSDLEREEIFSDFNLCLRKFVSERKLRIAQDGASAVG